MQGPSQFFCVICLALMHQVCDAFLNTPVMSPSTILYSRPQRKDAANSALWSAGLLPYTRPYHGRFSKLNSFHFKADRRRGLLDVQLMDNYDGGQELMISRSEPDSALLVCIFVAVGLVSISLVLSWDETLFLLNLLKNWMVTQIENPAQALETFQNLEYRRVTSFEFAFLSPIYMLMAAYPTNDSTRYASRSWLVLLVIAVLFGSVANTFGFYFFDFFMARCIVFDGARKGVTSWHSVLLCAAIGAQAGWLSNKATSLIQNHLAPPPPRE